MFKRLAITGLVGLVVIMGWSMLTSGLQHSLAAIQTKTQTIARGNITIPIEASGVIEPRERIEIKSEAGGIVDETPFEVGEMVKTGELLVKLNPEDEQRLVDKATKTLEQSEINLQISESTLEQRRQDVPASEARVEQTVADLDYWEWKLENWKTLKERNVVHDDEVRSINSNVGKMRAQKRQFEAQLAQAGETVKLGELDVERAKVARDQANTDLADARKRLQETTISAPTDSMLLQMLVKKGSVIVSGSRALTGGTSLAVLAAVDELYVRAMVDEADIGRVYELAPPSARPGVARETVASGQPAPISVGTPVTITVEAFPNETFAGIIDLIEPEPARRNAGEVVTSYAVRIRLTSDNCEKLFLGMQAMVKFVSESRENVLLVPNDAIRMVGGRRGVYVPEESATEPGKQEPKFVSFRGGLDDGMYTEIIEGLDEDQTIYLKLPPNFEAE
jgi:HlyD family secretion protein